MALRSRWMGVLLLAIVVASSIPPAVVAAAQVQPSSRAVGDTEAVRELIEAVADVVARLKEAGVDVSRAEELLVQARQALDAGDIGRARSLALLALIAAGSAARETLGAPRPVAAGLLMEIATLKRLVAELGIEELKAKLEEAEEYFSRGLVNETARILGEVRRELRRLQAELSATVVERARAEIEARVRARVREANVVAELLKELRKAGSLSAVGRVLAAARLSEMLRLRVNESLEDLDGALANASEGILPLLWEELGEVFEELMLPAPVGLLRAIETRIEFLKRFRDRETLPEDLRRLADELLVALEKLREAVVKMMRCEEGYEELLAEAREIARGVIEELAEGMPPKAPPVPRFGEVRSRALLYAVAKWTLIMTEVLPRVLVCPEVGSEVYFKGVIVSAGESVLAFGVVRAVVMVPANEGRPWMPTPARPAVRIGIFALDLSRLENAAELAVGDLVFCTGVYVGYANGGRYPVIEVHQLTKLPRTAEIEV